MADLLPTPELDARAYDAASRHVPLADLGWRDCRFAVNHAKPGERHLFCGLRAEPGQSWCRHHLMRCLGEGTCGERTAELALMRGRAA